MLTTAHSTNLLADALEIDLVTGNLPVYYSGGILEWFSTFFNTQLARGQC